jgi:cytochrome c
MNGHRRCDKERQTMPARPLITLAAFAALAAPAALSAQTKPAAGNPVVGKLVFLRCLACHSIDKGAPNKVGPNLNGVAGRKSGMVPGFKYSAAFAKAGLVWNDATLDQWLTRPAALVPGTSMVFAGLPKAEDRANVIAYLKKPGR